MARLTFACFLCLLLMLEVGAEKSEKIRSNSEANIHSLPYWIQDSLLQYADEIGDRNLTGQIRKIYRKDLDPNYVAYYEFEFGNWSMTFSAGPKTGDHRLVEEGKVPRTTDILIDQAAKMNKVCHKFFRLNADGTTICEDETEKVVASTMDLETLTTHVNMTNLPQEIEKSLKDFEEEWKKLAKEMTRNSSHEWKEISVYNLNNWPPKVQRTTIYKVLTLGESESVAIGTPDISKVEIKALFSDKSSNSKKKLSTLCLLLGNICSEGGKVNVFSILRKKSNLDNLSYITIEVVDEYESFMRQLKTKSIDFDLILTVTGEFAAIHHYTVSLSHKRNKRTSWSGFKEYSIPYEDLMPDYKQHKCCGCWSGCTPVAWAQIFAYYDRVAHQQGYRYSTSLWRGRYGYVGRPSGEAPGNLNSEAKEFVEALRIHLRTQCISGTGLTDDKSSGNMDSWFGVRQVSGKVINLSNNINQQVSEYIKNSYPVLNNIWYRESDGKKSGRSVVVTKIKERSSKYKTCKKVGWLFWRKTKCTWKTAYDYLWYRRMGLGGRENKWYPASAKENYGVFVAVVD